MRLAPVSTAPSSVAAISVPSGDQEGWISSWQGGSCWSAKG
jgi:hypothetical protein